VICTEATFGLVHRIRVASLLVESACGTESARVLLLPGAVLPCMGRAICVRL
jgi:hypothetical protein